MQVKDISNVRYGLQMPKPISGGYGQDRAADTFSVIQAGTRYLLMSPRQLTSAGTSNDQAAALYCLSKSFLAVTADVMSCYSTVRLL